MKSPEIHSSQSPHLAARVLINCLSLTYTCRPPQTLISHLSAPWLTQHESLSLRRLACPKGVKEEEKEEVTARREQRTNKQQPGWGCWQESVRTEKAERAEYIDRPSEWRRMCNRRTDRYRKVGGQVSGRGGVEQLGDWTREQLLPWTLGNKSLERGGVGVHIWLQCVMLNASGRAFVVFVSRVDYSFRGRTYNNTCVQCVM